MGRGAEGYGHLALLRLVAAEILGFIEFLQSVGHDELPVVGVFLLHHAVESGLIAVVVGVFRAVALHLSVGQSERGVGVGEVGAVAIHFE